MKKTSVFILLLLVFQTVFAQESPKRSELVESIEKIVDNRKYDSAISIIEKELPKYKKPDASRLHHLKGKSLYGIRKYDAALVSLRKAIESVNAQKEIDSITLIDANSIMGYCLADMGALNQAITYAKKSKLISSALDRKKEVSIINCDIATYFSDLNQYDSAIYYLNKAFEIDLITKDSANLVYDLGGLGYFKVMKKEYEEGIKYYNESLKYLKENDYRQRGTTYNNIGMAYLENEKYEDAEKYLFKSIAFHEKIKDSTKVMMRYMNLGILYIKTNKLDKALKYEQAAVKYFDKKKNSHLEVKSLIHLSKIYGKKSNDASQLKTAKKAKSLAEKKGYLAEVISANKQLINAYKKQNNFRSAFNLTRDNQVYIDSLSRNKHLQAINKLELKYVTEKKEQKIQELKLKNQIAESELYKAKTKQLIIALVAGAILIIVSVFYFLKRKQAILEKEASELRIDAIQKRFIELHKSPSELSVELDYEDLNNKLHNELSEREFEVLKLSLSGKTNNEISEALFLSVNTVKYHLKKIYPKLGVNSRKEAFKYILSLK